MALLLLVAGTFGAGRADAQTATAGTRRALLIGINDYRAVPPLQGSINDVETLREVLVTRAGFRPADIALLQDAQATRSAVLAALNALVRQTGPDDLVYVHYSGHGSQVEDVSGDEADGLDETLVPVDGRTSGVPDILDDELDAIFARLRTPHAVIVLDSCHSGTATRSLEVRTRSVPRDTRLDLYRAATTTTTRAIVPRVGTRQLVLSAAASDQEALDGPIDGRFHGFFSYALARSLASVPPGAGAREVFAGIARELARIQQRFGRSSMPEPQLEGPPARIDGPLFAADGVNGWLPAERTSTAAGQLTAPPSTRAWLAIAPAGGAELRLLRGTLLGAAPGSRWAVYPPGETRFAPGAALSIATVLARSGEDALARVPPGTPLPPAGARAVLAMPPPADARIGIRLGEVWPELRARLQALLSRQVPSARVVEAEPASYVLDASREFIRLTTADGLQTVREWPIGAPDLAEGLQRELTRSAAANALLALDNPNARLRVVASVTERPATLTRGIAVVADTSAAALRARRPGEPRSARNSLQLDVWVDADAYLTIASVDSAGALTVLFPNGAARADFLPEGRVVAGSSVRIPDSLAPGNRAGFYWDYGPPPGVDTIRVFAVGDLDAARVLRERLASARGVAAATPGAIEALRDVFTVIGTRDIRPVGGEDGGDRGRAADWAATTVTVDVGE